MAGTNTIERSYMQRALELASRGKGMTGTNPIVGAVLVRDGRIIGEGFHHRFGGDHAEIDAIKNAREPIEGADLYVTLEPCAHHGKTPPCVDTIKAAGIRRVITAMPDPNPKVNGAGLDILRRSGIEVTSDFEREAAEQSNAAYLKYIRTGLPYVTLKIAQTIDGRIADFEGDAKWITSEESRRQVHLMRSRVDAVVIGAGTARADNPALTAHGISKHNPKRIVIGSGPDSVPASLGLVAENDDRNTIIVNPGAEEIVSPPNGGPTAVENWTVSSRDGRIDLQRFLRLSAAQNMGHLLVEGGANLFTQFIEQNLADEIIFVIAPKLLGRGLPAFNSNTGRSISDTLSFKVRSSYELGGDIWIETEVRR